jgi:hypothetical protein
MNIAWTAEEKTTIKNLYDQGKSHNHILSYFPNRTLSGLRLQIYKLKLNYRSQRTYSLDENFWSNISPEVAYIAGFSAADASVNYKRNQFSYSLTLAYKDICILEYFKKMFGSNHPIKIKDVKLNDKSFKQCHLYIAGGKQWGKDLEKYWNIVPNKTNILSPPENLSEYLKYCYLIGYIDGDGCICYQDKYKRMKFGFVSCSKHILNWIHELTKNKFNYGLRKQKRRVKTNKNGNYIYNIAGLSAIKLYEYLKDFPIFKLDRKWKNPDVENFIEWYKINKKSNYDLNVPFN